MTQFIGGPGINLPLAGPLYPPVLAGGSISPANTYRVDIPTAGCLTIPPGEWVASTADTVGALQWYDGNVTGQWINFAAPAAFNMLVRSDGVNFRVANLSDSAFGGLVTAAGSGYAQATTTITPGTGNSTWQPVIGGSLGSGVIAAAGSNYTKNPLLFIPAPPYPGVTATARLGLSAGAVNSVTFTNAGAGYLTAPTLVVVPDPFDPNLNIITAARITCSVTGAGTLTAALLLNFGQPLTTAPTLTVAGAGASATATTNPAAVVAAAVMTVFLQRR